MVLLYNIASIRNSLAIDTVLRNQTQKDTRSSRTTPNSYLVTTPTSTYPPVPLSNEFPVLVTSVLSAAHHISFLLNRFLVKYKFPFPVLRFYSKITHMCNCFWGVVSRDGLGLGRIGALCSHGAYVQGY